jgi:type VII secretion protein EccE
VLSPGADPAALLDLVRPGATMTSIEVDGSHVGVIQDAYGLTAVVEIGDTSGLLGETLAPVPALTALLPGTTGAGQSGVRGGQARQSNTVGDQPAVRIQLLVAGVAAPAARTGTGPSATSYRQLTEGRILAQQRTLIAIHARRAGGFGEADVRAALIGSVRRVRRRLDRDRLPCRPLAAATVLRVLAELAHHDPARPVRESWSTLEVGGLRQVTFRLSRWPDPRAEFVGTLVPRLLTLPCSGTTVALVAERSSGEHRDAVHAELAIRVAAPSAAALGNAVSTLRRFVDSTGATLTRLDGAQLDGLGATLPLGGAATGADAALSGLLAGRHALAVDGATPVTVSAAALAAIEPTVGGEGLMLGVNRKGEPVIVRLFRPEPTRAALIGGLRCAETLVLRAIAVGAQVIVQSGRPHAWEPFLRGLSGGEPITLVPPGRIVEPVPATPVQPQLLVIDVGPVGATGVPVVESAWRATLLVRDDLTTADLDILARADLALLQPLSAREAALASTALGLGDSASWLTRIRADMLGVVVGRRTLRWALLSPTPIERQLIGTATR